MRQNPHLAGIQRAVGNSDAQHVGVKLQIDPVHQAQGLELLLGERTGEARADLLAKLRHAFGNQRPVNLVITIHRPSAPRR